VSLPPTSTLPEVTQALAHAGARLLAEVSMRSPLGLGVSAAFTADKDVPRLPDGSRDWAAILERAAVLVKGRQTP